MNSNGIKIIEAIVIVKPPTIFFPNFCLSFWPLFLATESNCPNRINNINIIEIRNDIQKYIGKPNVESTLEVIIGMNIENPVNINIICINESNIPLKGRTIEFHEFTDELISGTTLSLYLFIINGDNENISLDNSPTPSATPPTNGIPPNAIAIPSN